MSDAAAANTPIDQLANLLALRVAATDPILATHAGITELNDKLTDFSPPGWTRRPPSGGRRWRSSTG